MAANDTAAASARDRDRGSQSQARRRRQPGVTAARTARRDDMERASTADMVRDAIKTLGERGGSSLHNIKKYIEAVYQVDMRYRAPRIRKFLRGAVSDGNLVQTRGRGASGSFKLPPKQVAPSAAAPKAKAKTAAPPAPAPKRARAKGKSTPRAGATTSRTSTTSARSSASSSSSASTVSSRSTRSGMPRASR